MKKINNKGFTLIEMLAVIVIIAIIGLIAVPSVIKTIETSKQSSYNILVENITTAGKQLFEEIEFTGNKLYHYNLTGKTETEIQIDNNNKIKVNLQTLVSNGFLNGNNDNDRKTIINPKNNENIGLCEVSITKTIERIETDDSIDYKTTYSVINNTDNVNCPTTNEYEKYIK